MLMAELTFDQLPEYSEIATYFFTIYAPPSEGVCAISGDTDLTVGDEIAFSCTGWKSENEPLVYKVY
jgi:hypothetical protein